MFSKLSISTRLMLFVPLLLVPLAIVMIVGLTQLRGNLMSDREQAVRELVEIGERHRR